jgi:hypothetical protein
VATVTPRCPWRGGGRWSRASRIERWGGGCRREVSNSARRRPSGVAQGFGGFRVSANGGPLELPVHRDDEGAPTAGCSPRPGRSPCGLGQRRPAAGRCAGRGGRDGSGLPVFVISPGETSSCRLVAGERMAPWLEQLQGKQLRAALVARSRSVYAPSGARCNARRSPASSAGPRTDGATVRTVADGGTVRFRSEAGSRLAGEAGEGTGSFDRRTAR